MLPRVAVLLAALLAVPMVLVGSPGPLGPLAGGPGGAGAPDLAPSPHALVWEVLPDMPVARVESAAVAVRGEVWVLGGIFPTLNGGDGLVHVYNATTQAWREGPRLPHAIHHAQALVVGERILLLGGYTGSPSFVPLATSWQLDASLAPEQQAWEPFVQLPGPRGGFASATDGERVWIFGGVGSVPIYLPGGGLFLERTVWVLDLGTEQWSPLGLFPEPRDHLAGLFHEGKVYAFGGRTLTLDTNTERVDVLDVATGQWGSAPDLPTPRGGFGAFVLGGRIHVAAGEAVAESFASVEAFDPALQAWSLEAPMPEARHGVGVAVLDGMAYVLGGGPEPAFTYSPTVQRARLA